MVMPPAIFRNLNIGDCIRDCYRAYEYVLRGWAIAHTTAIYGYSANDEDSSGKEHGAVNGNNPKPQTQNYNSPKPRCGFNGTRSRILSV